MDYKVFWKAFCQQSDSWAERLRDGQQESVFEEMERLLEAHGLSYCFDITSDDTHSYLVFSPEGEFELGKLIDEVVECAPVVKGWVFFARRQKKSLADVGAIVRHLYLFNISESRFQVARDGGVVRVEMHVPIATDLTAEEGQGLVNTVLWHALGERFVMDRNIVGSLVHDETPAEGSLSLEELVETLADN